MKFLLQSYFFQMTRFALVGVLNTGITLLSIYVLYKFFNFSYLLANAVGFTIGFINSFFMNKFWTFKSSNSFIRESILFIIVFLVCYLIQLLSIILLKNVLYDRIALIQFLGMIIYTIFNYLGNKIFTFKS